MSGSTCPIPHYTSKGVILTLSNAKGKDLGSSPASATQLAASRARTTATNHRALGFAACAAASCLWGTGFYFGKIALREMNSGAMVFYRFLFAALAFVPLLLRSRPNFSAREWRILFFATILGVPLQFLLQFRGLELTTVSHASLMVGTLPVLLAVAGTLFAHEHLHKLGWAALSASTTGAALIAFGHEAHAPASGGPTLHGDLFVIASMVISVGWIFSNKSLVAHHSAVFVAGYGIVLGVLMLCLCVPPVYGLPPVHGVSLRAWLALIASGVLCTATTTLLWNWGMKHVQASHAGVLLNAEPLIGSFLGVLLLHDWLGATAVVGGVLILLAAVVITMTSKPAPAVELVST